jgi:hypothetical protein
VGHASTHDDFAPAAVERIAAILFFDSDDFPPDNSCASTIVSHYRQAQDYPPFLHGLADEDFISAYEHQVIRLPSLRFYFFAGFLELAVSAGYVI